MLVPQAGKNASYRRFAHFATDAVLVDPGRRHDISKCLQLLNPVVLIDDESVNIGAALYTGMTYLTTL